MHIICLNIIQSLRTMNGGVKGLRNGPTQQRLNHYFPAIINRMFLPILVFMICVFLKLELHKQKWQKNMG